MITVKINNMSLPANEGETILEVAQRNGIRIPTFCHMEGLAPTGACRICVVEVKGAGSLVPACAFPVSEGMEIQANSSRVLSARKSILELIIANHNSDCLNCVRNGNCELQSLCEEYGIRERKYYGEKRVSAVDITPSLEKYEDKCILCGRCVRTCNEIQKVGSIFYAHRGFYTKVSPAFDEGLNITNCINCDQCITVCPVGSLRERSNIKKIFDALKQKDLHTVVQFAPATRTSIGEEFGMEPGIDSHKKLVTALRLIGFHKVFDTNFSADLTIVEEAHEFIQRVLGNDKKPLPMFTSCCPGWVKHAEIKYPEILDHISSCKSPQQMMGAMIKSHYAAKNNIDPHKVFVVAIMPCTAKKFEYHRPEMGSEYPDVDAVLTTRELARIIKLGGYDLSKLPDSLEDQPFGESSGAADLFANSGGVMEAALRTAYFELTGKIMPRLEINTVRGNKNLKEAEVTIENKTIKVAVVNGIGNVDPVIKDIKDGFSPYSFIEVMACPGGCVAGGGQPLPRTNEKIKQRQQGVYEIDRVKKLRCSHDNKSIQTLYSEFLEKPGSHKAHELLHTKYHARNIE